MPVDSRPSSGAAGAVDVGTDAVELLGMYERLWTPRPENVALSCVLSPRTARS